MKNESKKSNTSVVLGLILGFILALITVYGYAFNSAIFFSLIALAIILLSPLILGIISSVKAKKANGGFITLKNALKNFVITLFVGMLISTLVSILIFNVIDPEFKEVVKKVQVDGYEKIKDRTISSMYERNTPEETIEKTEAGFEKALEKMRSGNQFSIGKQIQGFLMMVGAYMFIGLIVAAIIKKKNPQEV
jgi:ABC-type multidrug transport system fused ATPase/permease subunit